MIITETVIARMWYGTVSEETLEWFEWHLGQAYGPHNQMATMLVTFRGQTLRLRDWQKLLT